MYKKMRAIEDAIKRAGAVSSIVLPGLIAATWDSESDAIRFSETLSKLFNSSSIVKPDPTDNGNWIVSIDY